MRLSFLLSAAGQTIVAVKVSEPENFPINNRTLLNLTFLERVCLFIVVACLSIEGPSFKHPQCYECPIPIKTKRKQNYFCRQPGEIENDVMAKRSLGA